MYKKPTSFFEFMAIFSFGKITATTQKQCLYFFVEASNVILSLLTTTPFSKSANMAY